MKKLNIISVAFGLYLTKALPLYCLQILDNEILGSTQPNHILYVLLFLRDHLNCQFKILSMIAGADFPEKQNRFEISYELLSIQYNNRIRIKTLIEEAYSVQSIISIYNSANWWEREIWDMFGVFFFNHPDLRRILTDYGFEGYPLRKDFPLIGYVETRYDDNIKRVVCEPLEIAQEFRYFHYESPRSKK
jgi:NADH dehydrogenase (ubiquinone) Fe-S protein 3